MPFIILALGTVWLLLALKKRIDLIVAGETPPVSAAHKIFIVLEVIKLLSLVFAGWQVLKH